MNFDTKSYLESVTLKRAQLSVVERHPDSPGSLRTLTAFIGIDADVKLAEKNLSLPLFKVKAIHLLNFGFQFTFPRRNPAILIRIQGRRNCRRYRVRSAERFQFGLKSSAIEAQGDEHSFRKVGRSWRHRFSADRCLRYWYHFPFWFCDGA